MSDKRPSGIIPGFCLMSSVRFLKYGGPGIYLPDQVTGFGGMPECICPGCAGAARPSFS